METGATGLELHLHGEGGYEDVTFASRDRSSVTPRMAAVVARLHAHWHSVLDAKPDSLEAYKDRWYASLPRNRLPNSHHPFPHPNCHIFHRSMGLYLAGEAYKTSMECAESSTTAEGATAAGAEGVTPPRLASSLQGFGLPARAASFRALQPGGWLARRYDMGAPWPLLAQAMGASEISSDHGRASNVFVAATAASSAPAAAAAPARLTRGRKHLDAGQWDGRKLLRSEPKAQEYVQHTEKRSV